MSEDEQIERLLKKISDTAYEDYTQGNWKHQKETQDAAMSIQTLCRNFDVLSQENPADWTIDQIEELSSSLGADAQSDIKEYCSQLNNLLDK